MGRRVCRELFERRIPFVVVDSDKERLAECQSQNWPWLVGDATEDKVLELAGIHGAKGLATVLGSDSDNLFVVLSACLLSRDLQILARASDELVAAKMEKAGASRVVSLYRAGAAKMAQLLVSPNVESFIENVTQHGRRMDFAEVHVSETAPYLGLSLKESTFRERGIISSAFDATTVKSFCRPPATQKSNLEIHWSPSGRASLYASSSRNRSF